MSRNAKDNNSEIENKSGDITIRSKPECPTDQSLLREEFSNKIKKRFLYSNQNQGQVLLPSSKIMVSGTQLLSKHSLITGIIRYIHNKRVQLEKKASSNANGNDHLNQSIDKIHMNDVFQEIYLEDTNNQQFGEAKSNNNISVH